MKYTIHEVEPNDFNLKPCQMNNFLRFHEYDFRDINREIITINGQEEIKYFSRRYQLKDFTDIKIFN